MTRRSRRQAARRPDWRRALVFAGRRHTVSSRHRISHSGRTNSMSRYHLAQINVAELKAPLDSPQLKDFVDNLDRINELAENTPGFVWRLKGDGNDATELRPMGEKIIVNYSIWRDVETLKHFVYSTAHIEILKRKREWFERMKLNYVLWWVPP